MRFVVVGFAGLVLSFYGCSDARQATEKTPSPSSGGHAGDTQNTPTAGKGGNGGDINASGSTGNAGNTSTPDGGSSGSGPGEAGAGGSGGSVEAPSTQLSFAYSKVLVYRDKALYNPTDEFIFSTVIPTTHLTNPLGKYYLYYAPHDAPGGICLAYSDSIEGPYTEYATNPILTNKHQGRFDVTHVSSPHVMWMAQHNKYFMYFHGENTTTRWAHSTDGINWDLAEDNIAISTSMWGSDFRECSYARVFEYAIPGIGDRYTMMMMLIKSGFGRRIGLATSNDGKRFTPRDPALVSPTPDEGADIAGPFYFPRNGKHYVVYNAASGNIHYTEVGAAFDQEVHKGAFYDPQTYYPEYDKASAPFLIQANNHWHLFYDVGPRLDQTIALAIETPANNIVIDNGESGFSTGGTWVSSKTTIGFYGADYLNDNDAAANPGSFAEWKPTFSKAGNYKVYVRWPAHTNRPDNIAYEVHRQGSLEEVQKSQMTDTGSWIYLGRFNFDAGTSDNNKLVLDAGSDSGYTVADAAWFVYDD